MRPKDKSVSAIKMVFLFLSVLCGQRGKLLAPEKFVLPVIYHVFKCFKKKKITILSVLIPIFSCGLDLC